jgi:hypothetical protein
MAFLIRGLQEDSIEYGGKPGTTFDLTTPTWRTAEALLHAANFAEKLGDGKAEISLGVEWTGLAGRTLAAHPSSQRVMFEGHVCRQDQYRGTISARADRVRDNLPAFVAPVITSLYENFDFFRIPSSLVVEEIDKMRANNF